MFDWFWEFFYNVYHYLWYGNGSVIVWEMTEEMKREEGIEEDEFMCIICMERPPETMVLPCRHVVVCRECSIQLPNTSDKYTCCQIHRIKQINL